MAYLYKFVIWINCIFFASVYSFNILELTHQCDSEIYCYGNLLKTIQMAKLNPDSKTFVDMKLKASPDKTIKEFNEWIASFPNSQPTKDDIRKFVQEHFDEPGSEFEPWVPNDWTENPKFLDKIKDADFRQWAKDLNQIWNELGRNMTPAVKESPELYSIIHVNNPVIVPGGRFREFYYWDSYWIILGLLHSEMHQTAKGMLENFLSIIERYGFIPNGGRVYYLGRSQPPLLSGMIKAYVDKTNDNEFLKVATPILDLEFQYFLNNHMVNVNGHALAKYGDKSDGPRPESYAEDVETSESFDTPEAKEEHWSELKAAAESGMDFSSRWFIKNGTNEGTLIDLKCREIVPVELNAFLYWNARIISEFYLKLGNSEKSIEFEQRANEIYDAVQSVLWHADVGAWLDYDLINNKRRDYFVPTNLAPLWTKCFNEGDRTNITEKVLKYIEQNKLDSFPGGVPNTLQHTGEQWDFPNVWPPMQYLLIMGLDNLQTTEATNLAYKWAQRWVRSNFIAYKDTRAMYEKYLATELGGHGGGGEYEVQKGFGWSNGVIIDLLAKYGEQLSSEPVTVFSPIKIDKQLQSKPAGSTDNVRKWAFGGFMTTFVAVLTVITTGRLG